MKKLAFAGAAATVLCVQTLMAATYYKVGTDAAGASSFTGNVSGTVGWSTTQGATSTTTVTDFESSDFIVGTGTGLRIPATEPDIAFTGRSLTLAGGTILLKRGANGGNRGVTISPLAVNSSGTIGMAQDKSTFTLKGTVDITSGSELMLQFGTASGSGDFRPLVISSAVTGDETTSIKINGSGNAGNKSGVTLNDVGGFLGTILSDGTAAPTFSLAINGAFGGTITSLPASTTAVTIDYDGLPAGKGLRVATTTIPPALKTKLLFHASSTAIAADGARLLTFPAGTELDASEFSVKCSYTTGGTAVLLPVDVADNDDGTVSLVTKGGSTFYKIGVDPGDKTSFSTNYTAAIGWARERTATATVPFSASEMAVSDFVIPNSTSLRTPNSGSAWTFAGRSLRIEGDGVNNQIMLKAANGATITFPNLIAAGGRIFNGNGDYSYTLAGKITIESDSSLYLCGSDTKTRTITVASAIFGDATTSISIPDNGKNGTQVFHFKNAANFLGAINDTATVSGGSTQIYLDGPFGGTIGALSSKATLVVKYDGLPAGKGLRVSTSTVPDVLKTKLTFYSATADFSQHLLPLLSFPAGTVVNPSDFSVKHATSSGGTATVFENLTTFTADDGSVVLAVDATQPTAARMVKDADTGSWSWRFYGGDGRDVTASCGLTVPTSATEILFDSTEDLAAARANPGAPKGWRMTAFEMTDDADLVADGFAFTADKGLEIDLKGHSLTLPGSFFQNVTVANQELLVNGNFEADPVDSGAYLEYKPTGWTRGGTVALINANNSYAYNQRGSGKMCFLNNGANVSQTFTLPFAAVMTVSVQVANKNWLNNNTVTYTAANGNVQVDGTTAVSWSGPANANTATRTARVDLAAGEHTVKISCTSGSGMAIDNATIVFSPVANTITDSEGDGELHVNVSAGATQGNTYVHLAGKLKFVKEGEGVFVMRRLAHTYTGGNEIVAGKLTTTEGSGSNADWSAKYRPFGAFDKLFIVRSGGTLDIAANYDYHRYDIVLDGGTLRSGKNDDSGPLLQTQTSWGGVGRLTLTADSTFYLRGDVVFNGLDDVPINLNGHELLLDCPVGAKTLLMAKDMTNGTIRLTPSTEKNTYMKIINRPVDARTVKVIDGAGISPDQPFSVGDYVAQRAYDNTKCVGTTNLYVYGTFTPRTDYFYGCTMKNGSTIDLREKDGVWSTTSAATVGRKTVDFEDGAKITIDVRGRGTRVKVVDWTGHTPGNLDTLSFVPDARSRSVGVSLYVKPDGIYISSGTMIFVR